MMMKYGQIYFTFVLSQLKIIQYYGFNAKYFLTFYQRDIVCVFCNDVNLSKLVNLLTLVFSKCNIPYVL